MKKIFALLLTAGFFCAGSAAEYDVQKLVLKNGAVIEGNVLKLDGKSAYAEIPGTENINIAAPGVTFVCSIMPQYDARKGKDNEIMDSYFSKKNTPFTLCRWAGILSTRVVNKKTDKYHIERTFKLPKAGVWTHVAFVFEPVKEKADTWKQSFYVNGKKCYEKESSNLSPKTGNGLVELGKGWGKTWMFTGKMTDIHVEQKALTSQEIAALYAKSKASR